MHMVQDLADLKLVKLRGREKGQGTEVKFCNSIMQEANDGTGHGLDKYACG